MTHKRLKKLHQVFTWFSIFSLILQIGSGVFLYQPAFAEEEPTPTPEQTQTETETPAPTVEPAPEPTTEPISPMEQTPEISPTPTIEVTPTETPTEPLVDPSLAVTQPEQETTSQETGLDLGPSGTEGASAQLNPSISTDKADYAPEETVKITGENFPANTVLLIKVTRPDGSVVKGDGSFEPGSDEIATDPEGKFTYLYKLDGIEGEYKVEVLQGETVLATRTFTDSHEDYKHWADKAPANWQNGALQSSNSQYFEGEVIPHYWKTQGLTINQTYAFNIYYDYFWASKNICGFDYLAEYKNSRTPTFIDATPSPDNSLPEGYGNFYTAGADITTVSGPVDAGDGIQRYVQVTFKATGTKAEFYWGLHLAFPGALPGCNGAAGWTGASLQTDVRNTPVVAGATTLGGGGTMQINPGAVIRGLISGFKWDDQNGNGSVDGTESKLSSWTIKLCSDAACTTVLQTATTDGSGNYSFNVLPGTYYVEEDLESGWQQTYPASGYYGPLIINASTPTYSGQNFGNRLNQGTLTVNKMVVPSNDPGLFNLKIDGTTYASNVGNGGTTGAQIVSIGNHVVSETAGTNTNLLDYTATFGGACDSNGNVNIGVGENKTCIITNTRKTGSLTLIKTSDNQVNPADWTFDVDGPGANDFNGVASGTTLNNLPLGTYTVNENGPANYHFDSGSGTGCSFDSNGTLTIIVDEDGDTFTCTFVNAPDLGSISGTKFEDKDGDGSSREAGEPGLPNWTIEVKDLAGALVASVQTEADGSYSIPDLDPGTYLVCEITQAGWTRTFPGADCYLGVVVNPGDTITDKDFGNFKNVDITVCKYIDSDGDGTGDTPYTDGWLMTLNPGDISQTTDGTGCTTFSNLGPGSYSVTEETKPGWTSTDGTTHDFGQVESGNQSYSWIFGNFENVSVTACKLTDGDGDINTTNDQGVKSGWTVYLSIDGARQQPGELTGENGCYTWTNLGPGHSYDVEEDVPSDWTALTLTSHNFGPAQSGSEAYTYDFINFKNVNITVCKYKDTAPYGQLSAQDQPMGGWEMTLKKNGQTYDSQNTGGNGCYTWNNLGPGFYSVEEEVKDGWMPTVPPTHDFGQVTSGQNPDTYYFLNKGALKICGTKYEDVDGSGDYSAGDLPYTDGWQISIYSAHMGADVTSTDANGDYCFENLEPGDFTVTEENRGGWVHTSPSSVPVTLTNHDETADFFNFKCVTIWGYKWQDRNIGADGTGRGIKDPEDTFEDGWQIELYKGWVSPGNLVDSATTGDGSWADGYYEFQVCLPGTYLIKEVNQSGYTQLHPGSQGQDAYYQVEVTSGTVTPTGSYVPEEDKLGFDFANFKNIKISGYKFNDLNGNGVKDPGEPGIGNWLIQYWGSSTGGYSTQNSGYYELPNPVMGLNGLPPGVYHVGEQSKAGWVQTSTPTVYDFAWPATDITNADFGNFELGEIQGRKYEDINANGTHELASEDRLNGWTIRLYDDGWNQLGENTTGSTGEIGQYRFEALGPGTYYVCEVLQNGWTQSGPLEAAPSVDNSHNPTGDGIGVFNGSGDLSEGGICWRTTINESGQTRGWLKFGNYELGSIGDFVWEDANGDTVQDLGEPGIGGVTVYLYLDDGDGSFEPGGDDGLPIATDITDGVGGYLFENLIAGSYWVDIDDTTIPAGYNRTTADDPILVILAPGGSELGADFGYLPVPPSISLTKTNDHSGGAIVGDTVTYTLTLTNGSVPLIVDVTDVLPSGFTYVSGSAEVGGVPTEPAISGNVLTWNDVYLAADGIVEIIYQAKIDSSQPAGTYYNLATCRESTGEELAIARFEPAECEIVDSSVPIGPSFSYGASIGGTVLGITTERVLGAATGSPTFWLVMAILMILAGLALRNVDKLKKFKFEKIKKWFTVLILLVPLLAGLVITQPVFAASLTVKIADLPEYKNTNTFKLYYTALETGGNPISAQFYYKKEGDVWRYVGGSLSDGTGWVETSGSEIGSEGKYYFKVVATSNGETAEDETSTTIDWTAPGGPGEYSKERVNSNTYRLKWRTPNEDDFSRVLVYRSKEQNFNADSGTLVVEVGGAKDTLITWEDTGLEINKDYFYALRSIDKAGNASGLTGDGGTVTYEETIIEITPTPGVAGVGEVKILPEEEAKEGEILGGEAPTPAEVSPLGLPKALGGVTEAVSGLTRGKILVALIALIALVSGYFFYTRRSSKE